MDWVYLEQEAEALGLGSPVASRSW
ncbi:hypothetical protein PROAA_320013 [Candidatus Propionivibrio aalborgensis]|uniref:Uncharacterized protein n=1 Tax=Candidatus Propionivibrio aalborgensis TaxID=1860101 RepID=A0A1A8XXE3_9RHOO|nr:hypothetical protein PROAA_320013 [Candidatus Propionivibrio aalborgensis]